MARKEKEMTAQEKLACFDRVLEIMCDRMALELHMRRREATFQEILYAREDAYCNLVIAVMGVDALHATERAEPAKSHRRAAPRAAEAKQKSRGSRRRKS